jgi:hypothetical protein
MTAVSGLGALATVVSVAFALCTWDRYRARRRPHELAWTQALVMFALGSLAYWSAGASGWGSWNFRAFYLFGAILNVPYLAVGTVYLLGGVELGRAIHRGLHVVAAFCAGVLVVAPLAAAVPRHGLPEGKEVFGVAPRVMAAVGSGVGATVIIVGALWSAWKLLVARRRPAKGAAPAIPAGRLALTNVLIATGSIVLSLSGTFFTAGDREVGFGVLLVIGIAILFGGFLVSGSSPAAAPADAPPPEWADEFFVELWELAAPDAGDVNDVTAPARSTHASAGRA